MNDLERLSLLEIVKHVQVDHGDILITRFDSEEIIMRFFEAFRELHPDKEILVIHIDQLDILKDADEEMMRGLGWEKIKE